MGEADRERAGEADKERAVRQIRVVRKPEKVFLLMIKRLNVNNSSGTEVKNKGVGSF